MLIQVDAFQKEYDKEIKVKPSVKRGHRALRNRLRALYKDIGDYAYAHQYLEAKRTSEEMIKKRWGQEVKKRDLLLLFLSAVDEFSAYGGSIEKWLKKIKVRGW
jgi:hypothetical protein